MEARWRLSIYTGCGKTLHSCHPDSFALFLSQAKNFALPALQKDDAYVLCIQ
jgi:hypothetical protein